ncbi:MAG: 2-oxoglutarate dehydrogenase, E2 component, dihydrolipoamide succinyltransferase, partial [Dactylosporangium sp.]|nr:2-oxoglutarate dehydrogenase, E2 component, dihydrolipoamide succinyltransferase [Dactylosporangium sp.]NNJ61212.1 2-oxoglutarate dehydrogenase, E2 component, dihydrolipoamide succinyltransferase [Dactylosporangium sp.]
MPVPVTMPQLGESVTEGTITRWLKAVGDRVEADEPLLEVSTDKVDTEIPSPASGILLSIAVGQDETVAIGSELALIAAAGEDAAAPEAPAAPAAQPPTAADPAAAGSSTPVAMPALGESVTEGTITRWLKAVGDRVEADEPLLEVSTDKVDT